MPLSWQVALQSLLAPVVQGRLFPNHVPDPVAPPYIIYTRVSVRKLAVMDPSGGGGQLISTQCQLDVYAITYAQALAITNDIRLALQDWGYPNTIEMEQDFYEAEPGLHRVLLEIKIWHA